MAEHKIKYCDISIVSNKRAGVNGFTFRHKELGLLVHVYLDDTKLLNIIDKAMQEAYRKNDLSHRISKFKEKL